jgi:phenylalanyl-tRNA synthetase alpha subunit
VICDRGVTLGDLIGTLHLFFQQLGLPQLRFKPAFNPYTEPSMEIFRRAMTQAHENCGETFARNDSCDDFLHRLPQTVY